MGLKCRLLMLVVMLTFAVTGVVSAAPPSVPPFQVTSSVPLDIMLLQDETGSMGDDIAALRRLVPTIWDGIAGLTTTQFRMGVAGFRDYSRGSWGSSGDWVYRLLGSPTSDRAAFATMLGQLTAQNGADTPEGAFPAIKYMFTPDHDCIDSDGDGNCTDSFDTAVGLQPIYRTGARRVLLLATDAAAHRPELTTGYPGPTQAETLALLRRARVVVIGLVPGGAGVVPEVDELAAATGGSVQNTGASGAAVAQAIIAALGDLLPVSPSLSTISLNATSLPADGESLSTVQVTLRDTAGRPVSGHTVLITSQRGAYDMIEQPAGPTDDAGTVTGTISSTQPGDTVVGAIDISNNTSLVAGATLSFTPVNAKLRDQISTSNRTVRAYLNGTEATLREVGADGDYFVGAKPADQLKLYTGLFLSGSEIFRGVKESIDAARPAVYLAYPGTVHDEGWSAILRLREAFPHAGAFFDNAVQRGVQTNNWSGMTLTVLQGGMRHYAAQLFTDVADTEGLDAAGWLLAKLTSSRGGMPQVAAYGAGMINDWETMSVMERDRILSVLPTLSSAQEQAYIADLSQRTRAAIVLGAAYERQALLLDSLRGAHETVGNDGLTGALLRFTASSMAGAAFDGPGKVAVDSVVGAFDAYINKRKLDESGRGIALAETLLKGGPETAGRIFGNTVGAYGRMQAKLPPTPLSIRVASITNYTQGRGFGPVWFEENSFSDLVLANDSDVPVDLEVFADYGYTSTIFFGIFPYAFMPMVETEVVTVPAHTSRTVRIVYRNGAQDGSPAEKSTVQFSILASVQPENSLRFAASQGVLWQNLTRMNMDGSLAGALAADEPQQVVENPISSYVLVDAAAQTYEAQLWLGNPFPSPITADVRQTLPAGASIVGTDGVVDGATVSWQRTIAASDLVSATVQFRLDSAPGTEVHLPPASMSFQEPASGTMVTTSSNSPSFKAVWPLGLDMVLPRGQTGVTSTAALTLTNYLADQLSGTVEARLARPRGGELVSTQAFTIDGARPSAVQVPLPVVLRPGTYGVTVVVRLPGAEPFVRSGVYEIEGEALAPDLEQVHLPLIRR